MSAVDIIIMVAVFAVIGVVYYLIQDAHKKGVPMCGKSCGGCPHPCHSDGTPKNAKENTLTAKDETQDDPS